MFLDLALSLFAIQTIDIDPPMRRPQGDLSAGLDKIEAIDGLTLDRADGVHRKNVPDTDRVRKCRQKGYLGRQSPSCQRD